MAKTQNDALLAETAAVLLEAIKAAAGNNSRSESLKNLAEAYRAVAEADPKAQSSGRVGSF
ncbi:hypothetical protein GCM10027596_35810 [Nocardioides korecus]